MLSLGFPINGSAATVAGGGDDSHEKRNDAARRVGSARAALHDFVKGVGLGEFAVNALRARAGDNQPQSGSQAAKLVIDLAVSISDACIPFGATFDARAEKALLLFAAELAGAERKITPDERPGQLRRAVFLLCSKLGSRSFFGHEFFALEALQAAGAVGDSDVSEMRKDLIGENDGMQPSHYSDFKILAAKNLSKGLLARSDLEGYRKTRSATKRDKSQVDRADADAITAKLYAAPDVDEVALAHALDLDDFARLGSWNILGNSAFQLKGIGRGKMEPWRKQTASAKALNLAKLVESNRWTAFACQEVPCYNSLFPNLREAAALIFKTWDHVTSPVIGIGKNNTGESAFFGFNRLVWEMVGVPSVFDDTVLSPPLIWPLSAKAVDAAETDGKKKRQLSRKPAVLFLRSRAHTDERGGARCLGLVSIHFDPDPKNARWEAAEFGKCARGWLSSAAEAAGVPADAPITYVIVGDFNLPSSPDLVDDETRGAWAPLLESFLSAKSDGVATNVPEFGTPPKEYDAVLVGARDGTIPAASHVQVEVVDISGACSALAENVKKAEGIFDTIHAFKDVAPDVYNFFGSFISTRDALEPLLKHTGHSSTESSSQEKKLFDEAFLEDAPCRANSRENIPKLLHLLRMHSLEEFKLAFSDHKPLSILLRARALRPPALLDEFNAAAMSGNGGGLEIVTGLREMALDDPEESHLEGAEKYNVIS